MCHKKRRYPSEVTDGQWAILEPLLPKARRGRPMKLDVRQVVNAILYGVRTGIAWAYLPSEYPNYQRVYYHYAQWCKDGTWERLNQALYPQVRRAVRPHSQPSAASMDSQSVKTTEVGGEHGFDAGKKVKGRKRTILVDTMGNLLHVVVHSAGLQDLAGAWLLVKDVPRRLWGRLQLIWADGAYRSQKLARWLRKRFYTRLEIVQRSDSAQGFVVLPKRWVVERTFAWLGRFRRLSKDYERLLVHSEGMVYLASIHRLLRRLAPSA